MKTWRALSFVVFAVTLPLAACAGRTAPAVSEQQPTHPAWLAGTWEGDAFQVSASKDQGDAHIVIAFASDGSWKATSPTGTWSGTSSLVGDRLVLEGVAPDGGKIQYTLKERNGAGGRELWGMAQATFGAAILSLQRVR
jgi:hypothetical protein